MASNRTQSQAFRVLANPNVCISWTIPSMCVLFVEINWACDFYFFLNYLSMISNGFHLCCFFTFRIHSSFYILWSILWFIESTCLLSTCSSHLNWVSTIFSTKSATPTLSQMLSFLILYRLTFHTSNTTFSSLLQLFYPLLVIYRPTLCYIQYFRFYNRDKKFPLAWAVLFYHIKHLRPSSISTTQHELDGLHLLLFLHHFVLWTQDI